MTKANNDNNKKRVSRVCQDGKQISKRPSYIGFGIKSKKAIVRCVHSNFVLGDDYNPDY